MTNDDQNGNHSPPLSQGASSRSPGEISGGPPLDSGASGCQPSRQAWPPADPRQPIAMTREEAARRRVAAALYHVEEAQNHLARAAAAMSSLYGVGATSSVVSRLFQQVKRTWYRLEERREKGFGGRGKQILLDHEPNGYESEWGSLPSGGGGGAARWRHDEALCIGDDVCTVDSCPGWRKSS